MIKKLKKLGFKLGVLLSGVIIGGYLFSGVQRAGGELPAVITEAVDPYYQSVAYLHFHLIAN